MFREQFIDSLKGVGIICVVYGHCISGIETKIIYLFHMPLFFFISGYLLKIKYDYRDFFIDKFLQLIIPYFFYLFFVFCVQEFFYFSNTPITFLTVFKEIAHFILGGRYLSGFTTVFWFVPVLFITNQFGNFVLSKFKIYINLFIAIVFLSLGYFNQFYFSYIRLPYDVNVCLGAFPYLLLGHYFKYIKTKFIFMFFLFSFLGIIIIIYGFPNTQDMKNGFYGIPFVTFISAISIIFILFYIKPSFYLLSIFGESSIVIMYLHQLVQILILKYYTDNEIIRLFLGVILPFITFLFFKKNMYLRAFFLGSKKDLFILSSKYSKYK